MNKITDTVSSRYSYMVTSTFPSANFFLEDMSVMRTSRPHHGSTQDGKVDYNHVSQTSTYQLLYDVPLENYIRPYPTQFTLSPLSMPIPEM
jgi:hypothetical protein